MTGLSLHDLRQAASNNPYSLINLDLLVLSVSPASAESYAKFLELVGRAIDYSVNELESNPQLLQGMNEDQLSNQIATLLRGMSFDAQSLVNGGHVDIAIDYKGEYRWLGESKIWKGPNSIYEGFLQLSSRYTSGGEYQTEEGLLIFCPYPRSDTLLNSWASHLKDQNVSEVVEIPTQGQTKFSSTHVSNRSGRILTVRHRAISTYFNPIDRSGRTRKKA